MVSELRLRFDFRETVGRARRNDAHLSHCHRRRRRRDKRTGFTLRAVIDKVNLRGIGRWKETNSAGKRAFVLFQDKVAPIRSVYRGGMKGDNAATLMKKDEISRTRDAFKSIRI